MKIVVATTTFYPLDSESSKIRACLAIDLMKKVKEKGYPLVVAEDGSSSEFLNLLKENNVEYVFQTEKGLGAGKRLAISEACKLGDIILLLEPEKSPLIDFAEDLCKPLLSGEADLVIPKRKSLSSYPLFQQKSETLLNDFWKNVTGTDLDIDFGPRVMTKETAQYFLSYNGTFGDRWESIFLPVIDAIRDNKKVLSVEVDYIHPKVQRENEEENIDFDLKRVDQLATLSNVIHTYWNR